MHDAESMKAAGWEVIPTRAFSTSMGTVWARGPQGSREVALLTDERAANDHMGNVHGGALMTFADIALGVALGEPHCVTVQMQCHFVAGAMVGSLLTCKVEIVRRTRQMVFLRGLIEADGVVVVSVDAIFRVFPSRA